MKKPSLSPAGRQWLKSVHLTVSVIWLGAAIKHERAAVCLGTGRKREPICRRPFNCTHR